MHYFILPDKQANLCYFPALSLPTWLIAETLKRSSDKLSANILGTGNWKGKRRQNLLSTSGTKGRVQENNREIYDFEFSWDAADFILVFNETYGKKKFPFFSHINWNFKSYLHLYLSC